MEKAIKLGCCIPGGSFMPQGVAQTGSAPLDSLIAGCRLVTEAGFYYAEATVGMAMALSEEEAARAAGENLSLKYFNSFIPGNYKILEGNEGYAGALGYVREASMRVKQLGGKLIVLGSGAARSLPDGMDKDEAKKIFARFCAEAAEIMQEYSLTLALEPLCAAECNFINTLAEGAEIVHRAGADNFRLLADAYHMYRGLEAPSEVRKYADILCHVHVAEPPERVFPGKYGGGYLRDFAYNLLASGYSGGVTVECKFGADIAAEFSASREFLAYIFGL